MTAKNPSRVIIGTPEKPVRSSFMFCRTLKEPTEEQKQKNPKATATGTSSFLFSKKDKATYKKVVAAITAAGKKKHGDKYKFDVNSRKYLSPLRDGDELYEDEDYATGEEAKGMWVVATKCYKVPQLVDSDNERVLDPEERDNMMSSGNFFLASITFKGFDNESKGVRGELNNLMFIKEGERLDGSASAEQDFAGYAMDSDNDYDNDDNDDDDDDDTPRRRKSSTRPSRKSRRRSRR